MHTMGKKTGEESADARILRAAVSEGLLYTHTCLSANRSETLEAASFLYALIELLNEKGLISIDELDRRKREAGERLIQKNSEKGIGVLLQEPEYDKYSFDQESRIDCAGRIHLCRAACCRLPFALSRQDIREGVVHWDLGQPYVIAQGEDGYCSHLERGDCRCTVYEQRPVPCRAYDCRRNGDIWLDFERRLVNPAIQESDWPRRASGGMERDRRHDQ
jgi:Fe-S-cluster containining protein